VTVLYNTNFTHNPNAYLTLAVQRAAEALFGGDNVVLADNRSLVTLAAAGEHSTLICLDGQRLNRRLIERVRPAFRTTVLWLFEDPFMLDYNQSNADLFDFIFTNDPSCVASYAGKAHYLPLGASRTLHLRPVLADDALDYDIFFAGTMWPNRVRPLRALLKRFPDKRFKLICPTNIYLPPLPRDIAAHAIQWPISHESFVDFANASRVTLTMFRDYASHGKAGRATAPGPRLFELGLAGTAQVVEVDAGIAAANFPAIDGMACCDSLGGLLTEIKALLTDPALRQARAAASQRAVNKAHLFENRLQQIASITGAELRRLPASAAVPDAGVRRPRVLMCTHSTMREPDWGGVEVYQQTLVTALAGRVDVFFWVRRERTCTLMHSDGTVLEQFTMPEIGWLDTLTDAREETVFANIIPQYEIDIVHFQHLGHHAASLPIIAKSCGAGTVLSAHDFFLVCSRYNLLDYNSVFCNIGERTVTACDICLQVCESIPPGGQETRRAFMAEVIRSVDVFLFGTAYSEQLSLRIYPELADKRREVLGIPTPGDAPGTAVTRAPRRPGEKLKVAVVGNFLRSKGADTVLSVIDTVDPSLFEFHLLGKAEQQYEDVFRRKNRANIIYHGRYNVGELHALAACDVSLHLSIWPETFCIALSEAWQRGVVPIVTGIGALSDRVTHGQNGFVVKVNDAAAVIGYLEMLRADPATLTAMRERITPDLWIGANAYAEAVLGIYRSIVPRAKLGATALGFDVGQLHLLAHASWRELAPPRHIFDPSRSSDVALDLPAEITSWIRINGSEGYIDSVAGSLIGKIESGAFEPADHLEVVGWTFVPQMGISGQVFVALVGEDGETSIFLKATRQIRHDISEAFAGSPQQAGFTTRCTLHGKWSDGRYRIATINTFGERAAFSLTPISLRLDGGRVVDVWLRRKDDGEVLESFDQVASRGAPACQYPLSGLQPEHINGNPDRTLRHNFEEFESGSKKIGPAGGDITPTRVLCLRGWAYQPGELTEAGEFYLGLVGAEGGSPAFWPTRRQLRTDVRGMYGEAPERAGFVGQVELLPDMADGTWHVVICNVIGDNAVVEVTRLFLATRSGRFESVGFADLDDDAAATLLYEATGARPVLPAPEPVLAVASSVTMEPVAVAASPPRRRARR
jgi:glycosyltransferase involved in cell wall biosynthesis